MTQAPQTTHPQRLVYRTPSRWLRKAFWIVVILLVLGVAGLAVAPSILPEAVLRQQLEAQLSDRLGMPVTVGAASFRWLSGLEAGDIDLLQRDGKPLARIGRLMVRLNLVEIVRAFMYQQTPPIDTIRVEDLELWLTRTAAGSWNFEGLSSGEPMKVRSIQIAAGRVHIVNQAVQREITLEGIRASLGQLESNGQGYVNLAANLPRGRFRMTASLERLNLTGPQLPAGNINVEWTDVNWGQVLAVITSDPQLAGAVNVTGGRMTATFGHGAWGAEGALTVSDLVLGRMGDTDAIIPKADLGFQLHQASGKPLDIHLVKFSTPGLVLETRGTIRLADAEAPAAETKPGKTAAAESKSGKAATAETKSGKTATSESKSGKAATAETKSGKATAAPAAPQDLRLAPAAAGGGQARLKEVDLRCTASVDWASLRRNVAALGQVAKRFKQFEGEAELVVHVIGTPEEFHATGSADLMHTALVWPHTIQKAAGLALRLDWAAKCPSDFSVAELTRCDLQTEWGRVSAKGCLPLAALKSGAADPLAGTRLDVRADIKQIEMMLATLPGLTERMAGVEVQGPLGVHLTCTPVKDPEGAGTWLAEVQADLTPTRIEIANGPHKPAGKRTTFQASALFTPAARRVNVFSAKTALAEASLEWNGIAQMEWPKEPPVGLLDESLETSAAAQLQLRRWLWDSPVGRFEGTLKLAGIESAGPILAPDLFVADAAPVAGDMTIDLTGQLAEGRVHADVSASLDRAAIRLADYFVKPAGQKSSFKLTGSWKCDILSLDAIDHHFLAEATLAGPDVSTHLMGRGALQARWSNAADDDAPPRRQLSLTLEPNSTFEIRPSVTDLAKAVDLSPLLKRSLAAYKIEGSAEAALVLSLRPRALQVAGSVDLLNAALHIGPYLEKPRQMPLRLDVALSVMPPVGNSLEAYLTKADVLLGESVTDVRGHVKVLRPAALDAIKTSAQLASLLQEIDVEVHADWQHTPALRQALPWLEDTLYHRADLEGRTTLVASLSGTPLKGKVGLNIDCTACRILGREAGLQPAGTPAAVLKPAGTPATARIEATYGEVPGELVMNAFEVKLADSAVNASGRVFFDDPKLSTLAPPTAWSFLVEGRAPDAAALAALFPSRLGDLSPTGGITFKVQAAGDPQGPEVQSCDFTFDKARIVWLERPMLLNGHISYDGHRLASEALNIGVGNSDITLVFYIMQPDRAPTGSVVIRGNRLDLREIQALIQETSEQVTEWTTSLAAQTPAPAPAPARPASPAAKPASGKAAAKPVPAAPPVALAASPRKAPPPPPPKPLSEQLARYGQRLLSQAQLSCELRLARVALTIPQWNTTYEPQNLSGEGRLAGNRLVVPRFECSLNNGTINGELALDFRQEVPILELAYDAENLQMRENLKPFIDTTFPGMQVSGAMTTRARLRQPLAEGAIAVGHGETILTDGILVGPGAPDYIMAVFPNLKLTEYRFRRMSNDCTNLENGDVDNRMIFEGKDYNIFIFGKTKADGRTDYTAGVDLSVSLGSKVLTRTLDQGKLPFMRYTGRIVGPKFAEQHVTYVLPHEFAYDVFIRQSLIRQLFVQAGQKPPDIPRPSATEATEAGAHQGTAVSPGRAAQP